MQTILTTTHSKYIEAGTKLEAVPLLANYTNEQVLIGYQITGGKHAGQLLINGQYVLVEEEPKKTERTTPETNALVGEVTKMIREWHDKPYSTSTHDDCMKFARELITFFSNKTLNG